MPFIPLGSDWRRELLRTNLWMVPVVEVVAAVVLFVITHLLDLAVYHHSLTLPGWLEFGSADASREILTSLAAAVITVVGVVFSITMVTLTLASTQFGPRMLRNFIRDRGTQYTLGTFVATFVYATLALVSIGPNRGARTFVPYVSISTAVALVTVSMGVLIYFIHHIATLIQLPHVIASIAGDLSGAIEEQSARGSGLEAGPSVAELRLRLAESGGPVPSPASGYLQYIRQESLVRMAVARGAVIQLHRRPGQFLIQDHPVATVWPPDVAPAVAKELRSAHITGPTRTLAQDLSFAVDQLVEIAIRALSPAVNDTFTALTCIDWLGDSLCRITVSWTPLHVLRDSFGYVRVITAEVSYASLVERAFEKIRQASRGMPAVMIRQLEAIDKILSHATEPEQRALLLAQADMIMRACAETVPEPADRADVTRAYDALADQLPGPPARNGVIPAALTKPA
jgi:uncharacterized membrane protein